MIYGGSNVAPTLRQISSLTFNGGYGNYIVFNTKSLTNSITVSAADSSSSNTYKTGVGIQTDGTLVNLSIGKTTSALTFNASDYDMVIISTAGGISITTTITVN